MRAIADQRTWAPGIIRGRDTLQVVTWATAGIAIIVVQGVLLLAGIAACLVVLRRVGFSSEYGRLFFLNALGLWILFTSFLLFNYAKLFTTWSGAEVQVGHFVKLLAYLILAATFIVLALRFGAAARVPHQSVAMGVILGTPPAAALLAGLQLFSNAPADAYRMLNLAYIVLDGVGMGAVLYCFLILLRLGNSILGRFYVLFGAAVLLNSVADIGAARNALSGSSASSAWPDIIYAVAGVALVASFVAHARALATLSDQGGIRLSPYESLGLTPEEKVLSTYVRLHKDVLGSAALRQLEAAVWDTSLSLKRPLTLKEGRGHRGLLNQSLEPEEHRALLRALRNRYHRLAGAASTALGARVAATFGRDYDFLAR